MIWQILLLDCSSIAILLFFSRLCLEIEIDPKEFRWQPFVPDFPKSHHLDIWYVRTAEIPQKLREWNTKSVVMRYYCEYCDIYLMHSSLMGRRQHNAGQRSFASFCHLQETRQCFSILSQATLCRSWNDNIRITCHDCFATFQCFD